MKRTFIIIFTILLNDQKSAVMASNRLDIDPDQLAESYMNMALDKNGSLGERHHSVGSLSSLGEKYKDKAAKACESLLTDLESDRDKEIRDYYKLSTAGVLQKSGKKDKAAQIYFEIAWDKDANPDYRVTAKEMLDELRANATQETVAHLVQQKRGRRHSY